MRGPSNLLSAAVSDTHERLQIRVVVVLKVPIEGAVVYQLSPVVNDERLGRRFVDGLGAPLSSTRDLRFLSGLLGVVAEMRRSDLGYRGFAGWT